MLFMMIPAVKGGFVSRYFVFLDELPQYSFCKDPDLPDLLVFPSGTDLHREQLVVEGALVLQDKVSSRIAFWVGVCRRQTTASQSSCIPAACLGVTPGCSVVDFCAAPGMKTAHLAALMRDEGYSRRVRSSASDESQASLARFWRSTVPSIASSWWRSCWAKRAPAASAASARTCWSCGCTTRASERCAGVEVRARSDAPAAAQVEYALLDPPCSGSGMVKRLDQLWDGAKDERRLRRLANLQGMMLKQALLLPHLKRLVYSTCSVRPALVSPEWPAPSAQVHEEENEAVVQEALEHFEGRFRLLPVLPAWKQRGLRSYAFGRLCLRASPQVDRTNGFFVALFAPVDWPACLMVWLGFYWVNALSVCYNLVKHIQFNWPACTWLAFADGLKRRISYWSAWKSSRNGAVAWKYNYITICILFQVHSLNVTLTRISKTAKRFRGRYTCTVNFLTWGGGVNTVAKTPSAHAWW